MSVELDLLTVFRESDIFSKYRKFVKDSFISKECKEIIEGLEVYYTKYGHTKVEDWDSFAAWFRMIHRKSASEKDRERFDLVFKSLAVHAVSKSGVDVLKELRALEAGDTILQVADKLAATGNIELIEKVRDIASSALDDLGAYDETSKFVTKSIKDILSGLSRGTGLRWRCNELNTIIGPLHPADFIVVGARPETGKTTFITSELSYMVSNFPEDAGPVVIFNNEEDGDKIKLRCFQSSLNYKMTELEACADLEAKFESVMCRPFDKAFVIYDEGDITTHDVERVCKTLNPSVVVFNVLDKVLGFRDKDEVARLRELFKWARRLAKKHGCVIFAVAQADASAEGEKYLTQNQIYGSKTGVQGEADCIIMIGKTHDPKEDDLRFIHVPKNKLPGDKHTDPRRKHGYAILKFDGERGRYSDSSGL